MEVAILDASAATNALSNTTPNVLVSRFGRESPGERVLNFAISIPGVGRSEGTSHPPFCHSTLCHSRYILKSVAYTEYWI